MKENQNLLSALGLIRSVETLLRSLNEPSPLGIDRLLDKIHLGIALEKVAQAKTSLETALAEKGGAL